MKKVTQSLFAAFLLLIFLAGTTGISFYIHTCSETHKRSTYIFPELVKPVSDCCNEDAISPLAGKCDHPQGINSSCCRNEHLYLKAAFLSFPVSQHEFPILLSEYYFPQVTTMILPEPQGPVCCDRIRSGNSPPISGKTLVFFIHQIRIPSPASLS